MNEEYRYNDDNVEEKYGSGKITKEEYDMYVPRERMTIGRIRNTRRGIQGGIRRRRRNFGEYVEDSYIAKDQRLRQECVGNTIFVE